MTEPLPPGWVQTPLDSTVDILNRFRVPVNRKERAKRLGAVPYYGATGQVGWIDKPLFDEELLLLGEDGVPFLDREKEKAYLISGPSWVNNHAHVLRALKGATSNGFLKHYLNHFDYRGYVNGTTRLKLTQRSLRTMPLPLPPLAEQGRIVERIEELFARLDAVDASLASLLEKLETLRSAILADAFHTNRPLPPGWEKTTIGKVCLKPQYGWTSKSARVKGLPYIRTTDLSGGSVDWESVPSCLTLPDDESKYLLNHGDILVCRAGSVGISYLVTDPPRAC
ncbi:MAG: restriction endonuclease subunit S, partial [Acidimicrobiia bacterium]|nr:restriction endonuclease subunit S [Acidimicrobiia bacterium]